MAFACLPLISTIICSFPQMSILIHTTHLLCKLFHMNNYTEDHCSICELSSGKPCKHPIALVVRATYGVDILIVILTISFMEKKLFLVKIHMLQSARTVATVYAYLKKNRHSDQIWLFVSQLLYVSVRLHISMNTLRSCMFINTNGTIFWCTIFAIRQSTSLQW